MKVIAMDSGSSYMKALAQGKRTRFPSFTQAVHNAEFSDPDVITHEGKKLIVGESALTISKEDSGSKVDPDKRENFHGSKGQQSEICYALQRLGVPDGQCDKLVVSLPFNTSQDRETIRRVTSTTEYAWLDSAGKERRVSFKAVSVMPQGVGALRRFEAETGEPAPDMTLVVDVGSTTLDVVLLTRDRLGNFRYHSASDSSRVFNVSLFKKKWVELATRRDGVGNRDMTYHRMMKRAELGQWKIPSSRGQIDLRADFDRTREDFSRAAKEAVMGIIGETCFADTSCIVLTGGGAQLIDTAVWDDVRVRQLNVFANVEGQYLTGMGAHADPSRGDVLLTEMQSAVEV